MDFYYGLGTFGLFTVTGSEVTSPLLGSGEVLIDTTSELLLRLTPGGHSSLHMEMMLKVKAKGVSHVAFLVSSDGLTTSQPPVVVSSGMKAGSLL